MKPIVAIPLALSAVCTLILPLEALAMQMPVEV